MRTTTRAPLLPEQIRHPRPSLRFVTRDGERVLQQGWEVIDFHFGVEQRPRYEWFDVPVEEEEEA